MDKLAIRTTGKQRTEGRTLRDIMMPIFRQWRAVSLTFGGILFAALLSLALLPPQYEADMEILMNGSGEIVAGLSTGMLSTPVTAVTREDLNSEVELLKSRDLLEKVALACHLESDDRSMWHRATARLVHWTDGTATAQARLARSVLALRDQLDAAPIQHTTMIHAAYTARNPERAACVLQTLASVYQEKHSAVRRSAMVFDFFDQQADHFRDELSAARARLAEFDAHEGVAPREQQQLVLRQLSEFESALQQERTSAYATEKRAIALKALAASMPEQQATETTETDNGALLAQMEETLLTLELKRTEMLAKYAPTYRPVQEVEAQIADAQQAIARTRQSPLETIINHRLPVEDWIATESSKAAADRATLEAAVTATNRVVQRYQEIARQLDREAASREELVRNVDTAQDSYRLYLHKRQEAHISEALDNARVLNVAIAEPASVPTVPVQHTAWFVLGALLLAASVSLGTGYAIDLLDPSFRTPDELGRYLRVDVLASIPTCKVRS